MGQHICDAIHQLEGDKPLLSQVLPVWESIVREVRRWVEANKQVCVWVCGCVCECVCVRIDGVHDA